MSTNNEIEAGVPGVYELARPQLTANRDGFAYGDPVWVVSAWKRLLSDMPEDVNFFNEAAHGLANRVIEDIGEDLAFSGLEDADEVSRFVTCIELATAYGTEEWPRLALRDYLFAFEEFDEERTEATSVRAWGNARAMYDCYKFADGEPAKAA